MEELRIFNIYTLIFSRVLSTFSKLIIFTSIHPQIDWFLCFVVFPFLPMDAAI